MSLLRCRACRLTWFPQGGAGAACPACGGTKLGGTLELFHVGIALIALGLGGWFMRQGSLGERAAAAIPALIQTKEPAADKQEDRRVAVKDKRSSQVHVSTNKVKKRQKAKKRSQHVQR